MSFSLKTNMQVVAQGTDGRMALPWQVGIVAEDTHAFIGGGIADANLVDHVLAFPAITMLSSMWLEADGPLQVKLGNGDPIDLQPGSLIGFSNGTLTAAGAVTVSNTGLEPVNYRIAWSGH